MQERARILRLADGTRVVVPESPQHLSTFVLLEQGDWFEDEIRFLRGWVEPGMTVLDIGANVGVYALSLARQVAPQGQVWAFEPTATTAHHLARAISANELSNLHLIQAGLSDREGEAVLHTYPNSELNSLGAREAGQGLLESIRLKTLDGCAAEYGWEAVDLIKLDAEGEESRIIDGGQKLLSTRSPLVMYELKHGKTINRPLIDRFGKIGYRSLRLIPSLNVLVPIDPERERDLSLNLFACREDRAEAMSSAGQLLPLPSEPAADGITTTVDWNRQGWMRGPAPEADADRRLLALYAASRDPGADLEQRVAALFQGLEQARPLIGDDGVPLHRLATAARFALDAGERHLAVAGLGRLVNRLLAGEHPADDGPLAPPCPHFESIDEQGRRRQWLLAAGLEQVLESHAHSAYFSRPRSAQLLDLLQRTGFMSDRAKRRGAALAALAATAQA